MGQPWVTRSTFGCSKSSVGRTLLAKSADPIITHPNTSVRGLQVGWGRVFRGQQSRERTANADFANRVRTFDEVV